MIVEQPVIDQLVVEYATAADVFRLDLSPLDGPDLLAADDVDAFTWTPILAHARSVEITRGIVRDGITLRTEAGRAILELVNDLDPTTNPEVRPNVPLRIRHAAGGLLFTGLLEDVSLEYDKKGNTYTQIVAVDAVRDVANTPRYGAVNPGAEHEHIVERFRRLLTSSPVPWHVAPGLAGPVRETLDYRTFDTVADVDELLDAVDYPGRWEIFGSDVFGLPPHAQTAQTNAFARLDGLTPGRRYTVVAPMLGFGHSSTGATGESDGLHLHVNPSDTPAGDEIATARIDDGPGGPHRLEVAFTAPSASVYVLAYCDYPDYEDIGLFRRPVYLTGFQLVEHTPTYAPNIVHESDLASHLDIAATTGRTAWYVDTAGVLQVAPARPTAPPVPVAHFADDATGTHGYVGAAAGFDTADLVSSVELANHARTFDADAGQWIADDRNLGPWVDHTAAATYGQRRATLETTIVDVDEPAAIGPAELAAATLAAHNTVRLSVRSLRWNAAEDYTLTPDLEVWSVVDVTHRGATRPMRILGISHEITPTRWLTTLTLKEA